MIENPRYNVVSLRVSDEEWEMLRQMRDETRSSISEIMRAAFTMLTDEYSKHEMKQKAA